MFQAYMDGLDFRYDELNVSVMGMGYVGQVSLLLL